MRADFLPFNQNVWQGVDARHPLHRDSRYGSPNNSNDFAHRQ
jgi:hypothetical protein